MSYIIKVRIEINNSNTIILLYYIEYLIIGNNIFE